MNDEIHTITQPFLRIGRYHYSDSKARDAVEKALQSWGIHKGKKSWADIDINLSMGDVQRKVKFWELVKEARETGIIISEYQQILDSKDYIFGGTIGTAVAATSPDGYQKVGGITITSTWNGYSQELNLPCRSYPVEQEVADDILYHRKKACDESDKLDFALTCIHYRAYIIACITLLDSFINKYVMVGKHSGLSTPDFEALSKSMNTEERIELWLIVFANKDIKVIKKSKEWNAFKKIKDLRNQLTHATEPFFGHEIKEFPEHLNYVRLGIGGLLSKMRMLEEKPIPGFLQKLSTAPLVEFNQAKQG
jgi:hypothetical protein